MWPALGVCAQAGSAVEGDLCARWGWTEGFLYRGLSATVGRLAVLRQHAELFTVAV